LVGSDSVVVKDFSVSSSLCALKIFVSAIELVSVDDFCVSHRTSFRWWFLHRQRLSFVNNLWVSSCLGALKISVSAIELGFEDDFFIDNDSVFVNDFWVSSSLYTLKISASTVELGSVDDF
jgi:hypothetical protein